ncbi:MULTISPECIES: hypothetical protein [Sphingobacterium]|uniref:DUF4595 domain-containing protein n=1 Tax=Sphingobacterium populi TaxID=1812824 RepID=A0ABW5UE47_9SPHI|nr:hypothetical protein [Sphingobacterium sp. CFCC 11742]
MKNIIIAITRIYLLLILASTVHRANAQQYQLDSVIRTSNSGQLVSIQKNDAEKRLAEIVRLERNSQFSDITYREKAQLHYDVYGNDVQTIFELWNRDTERWEAESKSEWEYDGKQELSKLVSYQKADHNWLAEQQYTRIVSNDSVVEIDYRFQDETLVPTNKSITVLNEFEKNLDYETMIWKDSIHDWAPVSRTKNFYVKDTVLTGYETYVWKDNQWQNQAKIQYELDADQQNTGNYTSYKAQQDGSWIPESRFAEIKVPTEKKTFSNTYQWSSTDQDWVLSSQVHVLLNEKDQVQDIMFLELDDDSKQLEMRYEQMNLYDQHDRLNLVQDISYSGDTIFGTQSSVKYDDYGSIYQENHYELDTESDTWKDTRSIEFLFDESVTLGNAEEQKIMDYFMLNDHNYLSKKYVVKKVKVYQIVEGEKTLSEEYDYYYSPR